MQYKIYFSLWKEGKRISWEEREKLVVELTENKDFSFIGKNENTNKDPHYPSFYNNSYYFGDPVVIRAGKSEIEKILTFFKDKELKLWITTVYPIYCFREIKDTFDKKLEKLRIDGISEYKHIFLDTEYNWIEKYKDGKAIITDETNFLNLRFKKIWRD